MAKKELKKLSRLELIDIIYQLQLSNTEMEQKLDEYNAMLDDRNIRVKKAGSIAEAALALNGVFEAAQKAADQYLDSIKAEQSDSEAGQNADTVMDEAPVTVSNHVYAREKQLADMEKELTEREARMTAMEEQLRTQVMETEQKCREMIADVESRVAEIRSGSEREARERLLAADKAVEQKWITFRSIVKRYISQHPELQTLTAQDRLQDAGIGRYGEQKTVIDKVGSKSHNEQIRIQTIRQTENS